MTPRVNGKMLQSNSTVAWQNECWYFPVLQQKLTAASHIHNQLATFL
jgi:hypothetical protein